MTHHTIVTIIILNIHSNTEREMVLNIKIVGSRTLFNHRSTCIPRSMSFPLPANIISLFSPHQQIMSQIIKQYTANVMDDNDNKICHCCFRISFLFFLTINALNQYIMLMLR